MSYCEQSDIEADFKNITFDTTTAVTADQLSDWIDQESVYIDARIGLRYAIPVVQNLYPNAFILLKRICIFRVSERVRNKLEVKTNVSQKQDSDEKYEKNRVRTPNDDLDLIIKGLLLLKDVPLLSAGSGVSSFNTDIAYVHKFDVGKQQW